MSQESCFVAFELQYLATTLAFFTVTDPKGFPQACTPQRLECLSFFLVYVIKQPQKRTSGQAK